jgi:hypothetical protein
VTIRHRHPAYSDQWQPSHGAKRMVQNEDTPPPHPVEEDDAQWEPDYEAIMERRHEKNRPDWA